MSKRYLVIDALNMYFRAYIVDPSLSTNGQPIGGTKGFLKILQKLVRETKPDRVVIAWDGEGGSKKRKLVNKGYKEGRKPIRLNRAIRNMSENEELKNKIWQQTRLVEYLNCLPVSQIVVAGTEADDIISCVVNLPYLKGDQKVIVSSDKDFIQLCDNETVLFRPIQKEVLNKTNIVEKFGIHPNNFALARSIVGDKSDNLPGIRGVGLKTVSKRLPMLVEEKSYTIDDVVDYCRKESLESSVTAYTNISEGRELIQQNYKLMQLYVPNLPIDDYDMVREVIRDPNMDFNKTEVLKMMIEDGFGSYDWNDLFRACKKMVVTEQ